MESDSIRVRRRATHYPIIPNIQGRYREYDFERTKRELSIRNPIMKRISIQPRNTLWFTALTKAQNIFKDLQHFTTHQNSKLRVIILYVPYGIYFWRYNIGHNDKCEPNDVKGSRQQSVNNMCQQQQCCMMQKWCQDHKSLKPLMFILHVNMFWIEQTSGFWSTLDLFNFKTWKIGSSIMIMVTCGQTQSPSFCFGRVGS